MKSVLYQLKKAAIVHFRPSIAVGFLGAHIEPDFGENKMLSELNMRSAQGVYRLYQQGNGAKVYEGHKVHDVIIPDTELIAISDNITLEYLARGVMDIKRVSHLRAKVVADGSTIPYGTIVDLYF